MAVATVPTAPATAPTRDTHEPARRVRPRLVHPLAWWAWALGLAAAAAATTHVGLLVLIGAVAWWVASERGEPGSRRLLYGFLAMGLVAFVLRLGLAAVFGGGVAGGPVVLRLPAIPVPHWAGSLRLGGDVTAAALVAAAVEATRLLVLLLCLGAANALAGPRRLLRHVPATLYDVGTALVVALSYAPDLVRDASRVRAARQLRGRSGRGVAEVGRMTLPVVAGALERSLRLAASMESRGYGRAGTRGVARQRRATALSVAGVIGVLVGVYGLLDAATPIAVAAPVTLLGCLAAVAALLGGRVGDHRSRYRRDPWAGAEWAVLVLGLLPALAFVASTALGLGQVRPGVLEMPGLPLLPVVALVAAGLAGVLSPARPHAG